MESENLSVTVGSTFSQEEDDEHEMIIKGGQDLKNNKKFKKLRSIKLSKSPSTRKPKSHFRVTLDFSIDAENSSFPTSSEARTDISKKLARPLTRRSTFKGGVRSLARLSSKKFRKPLMMNSRSTRPANSKLDHDQLSMVSTPNSSKSNGSNARKMQFQASPSTPEYSSSISADRTKGTPAYSKPKLATSPGTKSERTFARKASLKPLRASTKSKRGTLKVQSEVSKIADSSVERATCSSTLKDSKFADSLQLEQGGSESEGLSAVKVCPFSYCSLHGHRHADVPPLKRLISVRRRMRQESRPVRREKNSAKAKKGNQKNVGEAKSNGFGNHGEQDTEFGECSSLSETPVGETSYPLSQLEENVNQISESSIVEHDSLKTVPEKPEEELVASKREGGDSDSVLNRSELSEKSLDGGDTTTGEPPDKLSMLTTDEYVETTSNVSASLAFPSEVENEQEAANREEKENLEPDHGFFQFPPRDSEPKSPKTAAQRMQLKDQKYVRMWRLMYKHAVKGVAERVENQPSLDRVDKTEQVGDALVPVESNNSQSSQGSSEMDREIPTEGVNEGNQQMERYQIDAVNLVQEAFDQILLPEIQELSSDDRSSDTGSDREVVEQDQSEGEQRIDGTESTSSQKEEKRLSKAGDKPNQKASKNWSNLKKIIILKRFVKALDKVKKINRGTPRYLPLQPEPEAEKLNLRCQTSADRKNAEEWMLDFALQRVISKLDPAQQRKVAILVKAFETVLPLPDLKSSPSFNSAAYPTKADPVKASNSGNEFADQVSDFLKAEPHDEAEVPKIKETCEECSSSPRSETADEHRQEEKSSASDRPETFSTTSEGIDPRRSLDDLNEDDTKSASDDNLVNRNVEDVQKQLDMSTTSEPGDAGNGMSSVTLESNDTVSADSEIADTSEIQAVVDDPVSSTEKDEPELEFVQRSPPSEESESDSTIDVAQDPQLEKQSYMRLWGFVYKHMMTGVAANEGTNLLDEADAEKADDTKRMSEADVLVSGQGFPEDQDTDIKDEDDTAENQKVALRRFEAIKLIEKAIDEILLPENKDNSHGGGQTANDQISDEEPQEKKAVFERKPFISDSTNVSNASLGESSEKEQKNKRSHLTSDTTLQEEQKISSNKQIPRSWSNLKKMILLKRFIKALDNVRKLNPRGRRFLPFEADPEAEKVNLKHLEMDEKRSAEEWMLDHALQQAVTRLTPARKRKVKLLVEAFETVTPTTRK